MYSSYAKAPKKPDDGRQSILTDHEALHRDAQVHESIQSNESHLTPLDLETILSNKGVVKYWYLHRPKTMAIVHANAVKLQSVGRAFAVRSLIRKYGINYTVELAKRDAEKREQMLMAEMSVDELRNHEEEKAAFDARVEETRRLKREQLAAEEEAERLRLEQLALEEQERREREEAAAAAALAEAARIQAEKEAAEAAAMAEAARLQAEKEADEAAAAQKAAEEQAEREQLEAEAAAALAAKEAQETAEKERYEAELREKQIEEELELERQREAERIALEQQEAEERERAHAAMLAEQAAREAEAARLAEKQEKYENSLSKDVPVIVTGQGRGRVLFYDREAETYSVAIDQYGKDVEVMEVDPAHVILDGERILSPRTLVDTPFGVGEVVGMDPHAGCYAVANLHGGGEEPNVYKPQAYVQISDVARHKERASSVIIEEGLAMPEEIGLASARIVDSRIVTRGGQKYVQYKLEIQTTNFGTVYCWKRYSTFRALCDRLQKEAGFKKSEIPQLPKRHIIGNLSQKTIGERADKLNEFLDAAVRAEHLQWGIKVDDTISVYKRRVKKPRTTATAGSSRGQPSSSRRR
ncbi:myosin [Thraustotheca clavata]|uniref:Myosin n=1 Tax=Thraustotheca clavata TaxID=74557 RepID=A0A1V9Y815_9STRA|nr:myosin [Thraustotheca clavata]